MLVYFMELGGHGAPRVTCCKGGPSQMLWFSVWDLFFPAENPYPYAESQSITPPPLPLQRELLGTPSVPQHLPRTAPTCFMPPGTVFQLSSLPVSFWTRLLRPQLAFIFLVRLYTGVLAPRWIRRTAPANLPEPSSSESI